MPARTDLSLPCTPTDLSLGTTVIRPTQANHHRHHTKKLTAHPRFAHINYILRLRVVAHPVLRATISPPTIVPLLVMHHFSTLHHKTNRHDFVISRLWAFKGLQT